MVRKKFPLAQGVPFKVVSEILGHSQISITADLYGHIYAEARHEAAARMEEVLHRLDGRQPAATVDDTMDATTAPAPVPDRRQRKSPC